jgi:predicted SAM-dependent methyltransferase
MTTIRSALGKVKRKLRPNSPTKLVKSTTSNDLKPKVHIGCGPVNIEGWINIDARNAPHVHLHTDVIDLASFTDGSLGEIYLCHVLEHFSFAEAEEVMRTFHRKLRPGGVLRISVPDFRSLAQRYLENKVDLESIKFALMGGQDYVYNFHKSVYDEETLANLFRKTGFIAATSYDTQKDFGTDLGDWSTGEIKSFKISLNMKATKP